MDAPLDKYWFDIFLSLTVFNGINGVSDFLFDDRCSVDPECQRKNILR